MRTGRGLGSGGVDEMVISREGCCCCERTAIGQGVMYGRDPGSDLYRVPMGNEKSLLLDLWLSACRNDLIYPACRRVVPSART